MAKKIISTDNILIKKIMPKAVMDLNGSFESGVVGGLLADDLIDLLAFAVVEIERSDNTTYS